MPGGDKPWTNEHTKIIARGLLASAYKHRPSDIYSLPGIVGEVDGHGNDRTGKKVDQLLEAAAKAWGLSVADVKAAKGGNKSKGGGPPGSGGKVKGTTKGKGRKRPLDDEDGLDGLDLVKLDPEDEEDVKPSVTDGNAEKRRKT